MDKKEILLSPIDVGTRTSQNRFFIQAMECSDGDAEGNPTDLTYQRYENLFKGNAGVIMLEAITITEKNRSRMNQLFIKPQNEPALTTFVSKLKDINPKPLFLFQLTHSGELSNPEFSKRLAVKLLPGFEGDIFTEDEFENIMQDFVRAAKIAYNSGADGIDMKLCHGYLGSQILRPYNTREWKYGGPWENRRQFAFDLYERIREAVPDKNFVIGSKISVWEGFPGGMGTAGPDTPVIDFTEIIDLVKGLEERGAAFFVQSAGSPSITISLTQADRERPYFAYLHQYFAKVLRDNLKPETVVVGSNYSVFGNGRNRLLAVDPKDKALLAYGADNIEKGFVDMIALGRQSLADPLLPLKFEEGREEDINFCTACDNCLELLIQQAPIGCCTYNKFYGNVLRETRKKKGRLATDHT
jgi:2,4-dienoyl-CoA reductase-like NADH-dependent reductase (Old Yellow Enzyme family)